MRSKDFNVFIIRQIRVVDVFEFTAFTVKLFWEFTPVTNIVVGHIVLPVAPFEVAHSVILLALIDVIDLGVEDIVVFYEVSCYELMNVCHLFFPIL